MADQERENHYYYYGGVSLTPQARRLGWEFPVYASSIVWAECCVAKDIPSRRQTNLDRRIVELLTSAHEGLLKKLSIEDDFLYFPFKHWYWERRHPNAAKKKSIKLAARLLISPETDGPWLYIFDKKKDRIDALQEGEAPCSDPNESASETGTDAVDSENLAAGDDNNEAADGGTTTDGTEPREASDADEPNGNTVLNG